MQGVTEFAMKNTPADWIIWIPDDVLFTKGGLYSEYASVLAYGEDFVGAMQCPYWNSQDLVQMGVMPSRDVMDQGWIPLDVPINPFWNQENMPRAYVNVNGAGFVINSKLWREMGGFPKETWRIDEYLGYMAWKLGYCVVTFPGPPRVHRFGGATGLMPGNHSFHAADVFERAIGRTIAEATGDIYAQMHKLKYGGLWPEIKQFFSEGGSLR